MPLPAAIAAIAEAHATASDTTKAILVSKMNARFLSPTLLEISRATQVGGATVWGVNLNGVSNANRNDFAGDGTTTVFDTNIAYVALANNNWVIKIDRSTRTGTVTLNGTTTVTGSGTQFVTELKVGGEILVNGERRIITAIASATSLTVDVAFVSSGAGLAIAMFDDVLVPTTDFTLSSNGGLCRITLTAAAKAPAGSRFSIHFVVPEALFTFATATLSFKSLEVKGKDLYWYVTDATATPGATNVYVKALIGE